LHNALATNTIMAKKEPRVYIVRKDPKHFYGNYKKHSIEIITDEHGAWKVFVRTYDQEHVFSASFEADEYPTLKDKIRFALERASLWSPDKELKLVRRKFVRHARTLLDVYVHHDEHGRRLLRLSFNGWGVEAPIIAGATPGQLADRFRELAETLEAQAKENGEFAPEELDTPPPQG
jgi:hypothetical protein